MANHFGPNSPRTICRNVAMENPVAKATDCTSCAECIPTQTSGGASKAIKTGCASQPKPRLAIVMPNCVALRYDVRFCKMCRARRARRCPPTISASNCVSRNLTKANSAATKNPLTRTIASTPSKRSALAARALLSMVLQCHLPENHFENVLQTDDSRLAMVRPITTAKRQPAACIRRKASSRCNSSGRKKAPE